MVERVRVELRCAAGTDGRLVEEVVGAGSRVSLGSPVDCARAGDRVALALAAGFATRAERDYAVLVEMHNTAGSWIVEFDMGAYFEALDRAVR